MNFYCNRWYLNKLCLVLIKYLNGLDLFGIN